MTSIIYKIITVLIAVLLSISSTAQNLEKQKRSAYNAMREANTHYKNATYADAEVSYKKALAIYPNIPRAQYNLANSIERQGRHKEAISQYGYLAKNTKSPKMKAQSYHNMGNAYMGTKNYQKAVDAYKNSLRINPKDEETRYNLALAQKFLKQQQKQNKNQKKNKDNKKNKDQKKDDKQNKKDQNKKDKEENKDNKNDNKKKKDKKEKDKKQDKDKKEEKNKNDKKDNQGDKKEQKQPQPVPGKISPQQAKQLLKALENEEKKTQKKVNAKRVKVQTSKQEKDW